MDYWSIVYCQYVQYLSTSEIFPFLLSTEITCSEKLRYVLFCPTCVGMILFDISPTCVRSSITSMVYELGENSFLLHSCPTYVQNFRPTDFAIQQYYCTSCGIL